MLSQPWNSVNRQQRRGLAQSLTFFTANMDRPSTSAAALKEEIARLTGEILLQS